MVSFFYIRTKNKMSVVIIFILILAILLVIFTLQNSVEITINAFFWEITDAPLVLVLIVCIFMGYLLGALYLYPRIWNLKNENKRMRKQIARNEQDQAVHLPVIEERHPEGIEMDDEEENDRNSFFKE